MSSSILIRRHLKIILNTHRPLGIALGIALFFLFQWNADAEVVVKPNPSPNSIKPAWHKPEAVKQKIRLVLRLKKRRVFVYEGEKLRASYPVAIGKPGWETPTGKFQVIDMLENPGWTNFKTGEVLPPGADNPLGERWIAFWTDGNDYIGFHGTPNRASVGDAISHGCVRMYNEDVRQLYEFVKLGTPVIVESK